MEARQSTKAESEAEYLRRQSADAKSALSQTMKLMGSEFARGTSVGAWTGAHPWAALSAATIAGFTVASIIVPSKEERALERLAKLTRALRPMAGVDDDARHTSNGHKRDESSKPDPGMLRGMLGEVLRDVVRAGLLASSQIVAAAFAGVQSGATDNPGGAGIDDTPDIPPT